LTDIPLDALVAALIFLVLLSAFFSAAEIAMVSVSRPRLRHLAESGHRGARLARKLLERPDRLIGVILLGSNFVNALMSALATVTAVRLLGERESTIAIVTIFITLVVLIFTDLAPKTLAALRPERVALPSAYVLTPLLRLMYPLVWVVNLLANGLLRLFGVSVKSRQPDQISTDELRVIVMEAGALIPEAHQDMLLAILDLENVTVEEIMVPRGKIEGVNLDAEWSEIERQLTASRHTRLPVYRGNLENVAGIIHLRKVINLMRECRLDAESFRQALDEPYFIPQGTPLHKQLLNFKEAGRRIGLVVDEYGEIQGLITMNDILEEIVGDFGVQTLGRTDDIHPQPDGSYLVRGTVSLRDLNRRLGWELPTDESRTLNGLILEYLEDIPEPGTSLMLNGYLVEIVRTRGTAVDVARVRKAATVDRPVDEPAPETR